MTLDVHTIIFASQTQCNSLPDIIRRVARHLGEVMPRTAPKPALLSRKQLAEEAGVKPRTVDSWISRGIQGVKLTAERAGSGFFVRIRRSAFTAWKRAVARKLAKRTR